MAISAGLGLGGSRPGVCTSTTRPSSPYEGMMIYETDTDKVLVWNGSAWYANWNLPWGYLTHSTLAAGTSLTANAPSTIFNVSYTHVNNRRLKISGNFSTNISTATNTACRIQVGGVSVAYVDLSTSIAPGYFYVAYATSTGSSQTFNVTLLYASSPSTAAITSVAPAQFILEDIGPA